VISFGTVDSYLQYIIIRASDVCRTVKRQQLPNPARAFQTGVRFSTLVSEEKKKLNIII